MSKQDRPIKRGSRIYWRGAPFAHPFLPGAPVIPHRAKGTVTDIALMNDPSARQVGVLFDGIDWHVYVPADEVRHLR